MLGSQDVRGPLSLTKDCVSDQTWDHVHSVDAGFDFDVSKGLGVATDTTGIVAFGIGGFDDQRITAVVRYESGTTDENVGVMLRFSTIGSTDDTYYLARVRSGMAEITSVVDGSFASPVLAESVFNLAADTDCTITFEVVGDTLTATFDDGSTTVTISATDTDIPSGGLMGFRTLSSSGWIKSLTCEEL